MTTVFSLPPELLLNVLTRSAPTAPSRSRLEHLVRQNQLRSFSLVHRSWTLPAQGLLRQEVWINVMTEKSKRRELRKLGRMSGDLPHTRHLRVEGPLHHWLELGRKKRFEDVVTIRHHSDEKSKSYRQIAVYAEFRCESPSL